MNMVRVTVKMQDLARRVNLKEDTEVSLRNAPGVAAGLAARMVHYINGREEEFKSANNKANGQAAGK